MPNTSSNSVPGTVPQQTASPVPTILGIWRLGQPLGQNPSTVLTLAQPADASGSPRFDYAIKRALPDRIEGRRQINQFVAAASAVVHPNVIPILDASTTGPTPYLVMPRIEGQTMQFLMATGRLPLPVVLWLVRQLAEALDAVHSSGWVHGDIKPGNAIIGARGHLTLIDFGFAARVHGVPNHVYRGTPQYSAPEALQGQMAMMPAMDIFSLGRVLWEGLTRIEPALESLLEPVAALIEQMVASHPQERPNAGQVAKQLLRLEIETLGCHIGPSTIGRAA